MRSPPPLRTPWAVDALKTDPHGFVSELQLRLLARERGWTALGIDVPMLMVSEVLSGDELRATGSDIASRVTLDRDEPTEGRLSGGDPARYRGKLAPLRKRPGNPFANLVSIGRALSCDLVLSLATVSKLQGYFRLDEATQTWSFLDQRSHNGSRLNGELLRPNTLYPVTDGDQIAVADEVVLTFLGLESLARRLVTEPPGAP